MPRRHKTFHYTQLTYHMPFIRQGRAKKEFEDPKVAAEVKKRQDFKESHALTEALAEGNPNDIMLNIIKCLAAEAVETEYERELAFERSEDTTSFSSKRTTALKASGDYMLKYMDRVKSEMDLDGPGAEKITDLLLKITSDFFEENGFGEDLFEAYTTYLDEQWEKRVSEMGLNER